MCGVGADIHHDGSGVYDFSHSIVLKAPSETGPTEESVRAKHMGHRSMSLTAHTHADCFLMFLGCYGCRLWQCHVFAHAKKEELTAERW